MSEPKLSRMGLVAWELGAAITATELSFLGLLIAPKPEWLWPALWALGGAPLLLITLVGAPIIGYALARRHRRQSRWGVLLFSLTFVPTFFLCAFWWMFLKWNLEEGRSDQMPYYMVGTVLHLALVGLLWCTCMLLPELRSRR